MKLAELNAQLNDFNEQLHEINTRERIEYMAEVAPIAELARGSVDFDREDVKRAMRVIEINEEKIAIMYSIMDAEHEYVVSLDTLFDQNPDITEIDWNAIPVVSGLKIYRGGLESALKNFDASEQDFETAYHAIMVNSPVDEDVIDKSLKSIFNSFNDTQSLLEDYSWMFRQAEEVIDLNHLGSSQPGEE